MRQFPESATANENRSSDSTTDPPAGYLSLPVDLIKGFATLRERAATNKYSSQFDFDFDINHLVSRANDAHLNIGLCSQGLFRFEHDVALVSISTDSLQLPELYTYGMFYYHRAGE